MTKEKVDELQQRLEGFPQIRGLPKLTGNIMKQRGWTGKEYQSLLRLIVISLQGLVSENVMQSW
jgi:hypothetical protein